MKDYFIRRILLIPPTLLGISVLVFAITRLAPGGPLEQAMMQMRQVSQEGGGGPNPGSDQVLSEEQMDQMKRLYGFDKPHWEAYLIWLGLLPREIEFRQIRFLENEKEISERIRLPSFHLAELDWDRDGYLQRREVPSHLRRQLKFDRFDLNRDGEIDALEAERSNPWVEGAREEVRLVREGQAVRIANEGELLGNWQVRMKEVDANNPNAKPVAELFMISCDGVLQGNFGKSNRYGEPVLQVILERLPVSTYFGLLTFVITYLVCIPLGVFKAIRHKQLADDLSSVLIFIGYAVPGYALGSLLLLFLSVHLDLLPMGGLVGEDFDELSLPGKIADLSAHTIQPLCCYLVGGFAFVTMMMKNHLMDNLSADYVRTAMAKGVSFKNAVRKHALRNSLVPLATNVGHQITLFVTGSFLIETIFDVDGFGLLGFTSVIDRDYPVVMGVLSLSATLMLLGNVLSDALVALADPRVRFE